MKELSLNILDIAMNSVKAKADTVSITLTETDETFTMSISDNGCGMKKDFLETVTDPFSTTRTTRKVGMGIPFLKLAAEQTGGNFEITSKHESEYPNAHGTVTSAVFNKGNIDFTPLGDIVSTVTTLIQGSPDIHWVFSHTTPKGEVSLDTNELKEVLGDVPLDNTEVILWIKGYLEEAYSETE
ncbi:MAG: sensor histidine kinase [Oscillospiraceae bacterium]|nr:sensor histidine kinase [Oscillospiraceae bacterium]